MATQAWFRWDGDDLILTIRAQPRAKRDAIVGIHGDALKVQLKSPPVGGKANAGLTAFLATEFQLPRARVILERGPQSRLKKVRLQAPRRIPAAVKLLMSAG